MTTILKFSRVIFLLVNFLFLIQEWIITAQADEQPNQKIQDEIAALQDELKRLKTWHYFFWNDEVRNKKVYTARVASLNSVEFDFPYSGKDSLIISIRKHPEYGNDVIFHVTRGQFNCSYDNCTDLINFDGKLEKLTLVESGDGSSNYIFAKYHDTIIKKLLNSEKVVIELPFYREGKRQFEFATEGLKWPPESYSKSYNEFHEEE